MRGLVGLAVAAALLLPLAGAAPADAELRLAPPLHLLGDVRLDGGQGLVLLPHLERLAGEGRVLNITLLRERSGEPDQPPTQATLPGIPPPPELLPPLKPKPPEVQYIEVLEPEGIAFTTWQSGARALLAVGPYDTGHIALGTGDAVVREASSARAGSLPDPFAPQEARNWLAAEGDGVLRATGTVRALFQGVGLVVQNRTSDLAVDTTRGADGSGWVAVLRWTDARLLGRGAFEVLAPRLGFQVEGALEAARAWGGVMVDDAQSKAQGQTLRAEGTMQGTLAPGGGAVRLRGQGDLASLALGGTTQDYTRVAAAGAGVALASALLYYGRFFTFLYARIAPSEVLDNEVRRKVHAHVLEHPGADVKGTAEAVGVSWSTAAYHLARLQREGLVLARRAGRSKRFFVNGTDSSSRADAIAALRNPTALAIAELVASRPGLMQKEIGAALNLPASTVSWHMRRLRALDVVVEERRWRRAEYAPGPQWPALAGLKGTVGRPIPPTGAAPG